MRPPHISVAQASGEGEETGASGKTTYKGAGLVLRGQPWSPLRRTAPRGMSVNPA